MWRGRAVGVGSEEEKGRGTLGFLPYEPWRRPVVRELTWQGGQMTSRSPHLVTLCICNPPDLASLLRDHYHLQCIY